MIKKLTAEEALTMKQAYEILNQLMEDVKSQYADEIEIDWVDNFNDLYVTSHSKSDIRRALNLVAALSDSTEIEI